MNEDEVNVMAKLKYLVIDVDGTMTDAGIYYDENGNELKKFCTKDAAGFFAAHQLGIKIMVLTGRECKATIRRMTELKVDYLCQNVKNKTAYLEQFIKEHDITSEEIGYIGDDLNDYPPMKLCGYIGCPADSCEEIRGIADYVSDKNGGHGAVRDVIEHILRETGDWDSVISKVYRLGI
jgi:3-deoxy-D-manno-octulosonate 8-phosphate phosphatase (KDO 8-P phosphatase)